MKCPDCGGYRDNPVTELSPEEADRAINQRALPVFHNFRNRDGEAWYRLGDDNEFSEFTFCPSMMMGYEGRCYPQMSGSRDTGIATGQYAYCRPRKNTIEVVGAANPFVVSYKKDGENPAYRFARLCRQLLRLAETVAGRRDWSENMGAWGFTGLETGPFPVSSLNHFFKYPLDFAHEFRRNGEGSNRISLPSRDLGEQITKAIIDWGKFKQVHPLNILLSRLGFDGVSWAGEALEYGDSGDWGCLLFPPITYMGEVVGLNPTLSKYMIFPY